MAPRHKLLVLKLPGRPRSRQPNCVYIGLMEELWNDLRYGVRMLVNSPGFTLIAIATLALGIGVNTAVFSVVNGVLLQPLSFRQASQLVALYEDRAAFRDASIAYPNFLDWQRNNRCFESLAAFRPDNFTLTALGKAERLKGEMISAGFFPMLGVQPLLGRDLDRQQDHLGGRPEVLISEGLWRRKFGGSRDVLDKSMRLNGTDYIIVGVIPASFRLDIQNFQVSDLYVPIEQWNYPLFRMRNVGLGMDAIGRLKPGVTLEQARANMHSVTHYLATIYPKDDFKVGATVVPLKEQIVGDVRPYLLVLLAAVLFVLLIACVNVANLMLARSMVRAREFAIRLALGARKLRIVRQLLTESVLLSLCGGALGLVLAAWGVRISLVFLAKDFPRSEEVRLDTSVLLFTLGISLLSGILFGMVPAFKTFQPNLQNTLREGGRGARGVRSRTQSIFAALEMAMAVLLLIGAGLMIRSLVHLWNVDPGFRPKNLMVFEVALPPSMETAPPQAIRTELRRIHQEIASVPGVSAVSLQSGGLPMYGDSDDPFWIAGTPKPARESDMPWALWYEVEPDYFKVMGIPLKYGRLLTAQDNENSPPVTVIDESFAQKYFPNANPIGRSITDEFLGKPAEIVGVVGHVKQWGLDDKRNLHAQFYIPITQIPAKNMARLANSTGVLVRTTGSPLALVEPITNQITHTNSEEVVFNTHTYEEIVSRSLDARSFSMTLLGVFAALALILASIGIYGVVSYVVGQRTHEIGIRMALGAQRRDVLNLVIGEGAQTALVGVGIGLLAALGLTQLMSSVLFGVSATDPLTFFAVAFFLTCVALIASYVPARRAMRVDPVIALRYE
jgi:predicted permease